jgi:transcriptional regulator with XRE-family HTH domain
MNARKLTEPQRQAVERLNKIWNAKKKTLELTQEKVSHLCGWHGQSAFSQYLHGRVGMAAEAVLKMTKVLKVEPIEIMPELEELLPKEAAQAATENKAGEALKLALSILELPASQRAALLKISNALGSKVDESAASG